MCACANRAGRCYRMKENTSRQFTERCARRLIAAVRPNQMLMSALSATRTKKPLTTTRIAGGSLACRAGGRRSGKRLADRRAKAESAEHTRTVPPPKCPTPESPRPGASWRLRRSPARRSRSGPRRSRCALRRRSCGRPPAGVAIGVILHWLRRHHTSTLALKIRTARYPCSLFQTSRATSTVRASFCHWSSSVSRLPCTVEEKPHWWLRHSWSRST